LINKCIVSCVELAGYSSSSLMGTRMLGPVVCLSLLYCHAAHKVNMQQILHEP